MEAREGRFGGSPRKGPGWQKVIVYGVGSFVGTSISK